MAAVLGAVVIASAVAVPVAVFTRGGASPTPSAGASPTPDGQAEAQAKALYQQVYADAQQSAGFQYVATTTITGNPNQTISGTAGQHAGTQQLDETSDYGTERFSLRLTSDGTVYFQGNVPSLEDQLGLSPSAAASVGSSWVRVVLGDGPYHDLWEGITVDSQMQEYSFEATSTATVHGSGGSTLTRISGSVPPNTTTWPTGASAHFDVPSGTHLPSTCVMSASSGGETVTSTTTFTDWGTAPSVTAPSTSLAWSSLPSSVPPSGYGSGATPNPGSSPTTSPTHSSTPSPSSGAL